MPCLQPWMSDTEESPFMDPALRKRAVKVKHVKRREKKSEKKVMERVNWVCTGEDGAGRETGKSGAGQGKNQKAGVQRQIRPEADLLSTLT